MSKLIEKEGRFYKKCVIVMLETKDCTNIHKDKRANSYPKLQKPSFWRFGWSFQFWKHSVLFESPSIFCRKSFHRFCGNEYGCNYHWQLDGHLHF